VRCALARGNRVANARRSDFWIAPFLPCRTVAEWASIAVSWIGFPLSPVRGNPFIQKRVDQGVVVVVVVVMIGTALVGLGVW
jgi:hypothetical protein